MFVASLSRGNANEVRHVHTGRENQMMHRVFIFFLIPPQFSSLYYFCRHSLPEPHELVRNGRNAIRDRYYGENDELAEKMLHRVKHGETKAPEDTSVTSIIIRGVSDRLTESDVRDYFYAFGEISSVVLIAKKEIGYVNYVLRESAERAIERSYGDVVIKGCQLQVAWSKSKSSSSESGRKAENSMASSSGHGSDGKGGAKSKMPPPPPGSSKISYDAQDPYQLGSRN